MLVAQPIQQGPPASGPSGQQTFRRNAPGGKLIQVHPEDEQDQGPRSVGDRIKGEAKKGASGLMVSAIFHAILLVVFALMVVTQKFGSSVFTLDSSWVSGQLSENSAARGAGPVQLNQLNLDNLDQPEVVENNPSENEGENGAGEEGNQGRSVRPVNVERLLVNRSTRIRKQMLQQAGANDQTEQVINSGLMWLARHQGPSGKWRLHEGYPDPGWSTIRTDTGATALALLAFLGAGYTHVEGDHSGIVRAGLNWLVGVQKENGNLHDHNEFGRKSTYYAHSQATIALCEAYAMTGEVSLERPARLAVKFLLDSQHPTNGGWRYQPQTEQSEGDLSVTGWCLMALHAARNAGFPVPDDTFYRAANFLDSVQLDEGARYRYMPSDPDSKVSLAMTASGLLGRQYLGWPKDHPALQEGIKDLLLERHQPNWIEGRRNLYAAYYQGNVLHNFDEKMFRKWYKEYNRIIIENQVRISTKKKGLDTHGSWNPTKPAGSFDEHSNIAGRLYFTVLNLLILEMPFRYSPVAIDAGV